MELIIDKGQKFWDLNRQNVFKATPVIRFTLRQLEYLVAVADAGSVAAAAQGLNVSQPSVSAALAKLEQQLDVQLLIRHHAQGVSLTGSGRQLIAQARNLISHARELQRDARPDSARLAGDLNVGAFETLAAAYMPALVAGFAALHPEVRFHLSEGTQDDLVEGLRRGKIELALTYDLDLPPDVDLKTLARLESYVLLPAGHRLAQAHRLRLSQLADEPFVLLDIPPSRDYFVNLLRASGIEPRIAFASPSLELVRGLVGQGLGYSLLVTRPAGDQTYDGRALVVRPLGDEAVPSVVTLAALVGVRPTRAATAFAKHCQTWFEQPPE